jgi:GAF domain-containing protein
VSVLHLIASYVRDHRSDLKGRRVFVNLLVRSAERIDVIARSDAKRPLPQSYGPEECSIACAAIDTGAPQVTGDVYRDAPKTKEGKPYKSILALPIILERQVLGAVSIDSKEPYHFEGHVEDLEVQLAPYVQLLAPTLVVAAAVAKDHDHATNSAGIGALPAGSEEKFDDPDI